MTDKQIIIDGCDVSGCDELARQDKNTLICEITGYLCEDRQNCHYKQLKRKEQECEELKTKLLNWLGKEGLRQSDKEFYEEQLDQLKKESENWESLCKHADKQIEELEAEIETLKQYKASKQASYESMQREWNEAVNENRELKAENETLRQFLSKEPLALQALQSGYSSYKKSTDVFYEMVKEYQKALTEIKEIALGVRNYLNCPSPKDVRFEMDIILQKISEVLNVASD